MTGALTLLAIVAVLLLLALSGPPVSKCGVNPPNTSDERPPAPQGSGGPDPHWEAFKVFDGDDAFGWKVRWSKPDKRGCYLWVGHYHAGPPPEGPSLGWCEVAAKNHAKRLNQQCKLPWEYPAYRSHDWETTSSKEKQ